MKKLISFASIAIIFASVQGQYVNDALKYSVVFPAVTARSMSMGNAFSSLGGDYASALINPAGLGLYRKSEIVATPGFVYTKTASSYLGNKNDDSRYQFHLGNAGFVGTYNTGKDKGLVSASFLTGYNRLNDYGTNTYIQGMNADNSLADYFMENADGIDPENLEPFYERLAFDAYVIDTVPGSAYIYQTPVFLPVSQRKIVETTGGSGEWRFAMGVNFSNVFYFGMGLGLQRLRYDQTAVHSEYDVDNLNDFGLFHYTEDLRVDGYGINANFGMMARLFKIMRIGGSIQIPTYYNITEDYYNTMYSEFDNGDSYMVLPTDGNGDLLDHGTFEYNLNTPLKLQGGASVQIGKTGIVSADVEFIDYSGMRLREEDPYTDFSETNNAIQSTYRSVVNLKIGGEARFGSLALRLGGGYYPSPYNSDELNSNASYSEITTGVGYRNEFIFIDFGFSRVAYSENYILYFNNAANLDHSRYKFLTTMGFRF
jgi:hypothetical protein